MCSIYRRMADPRVEELAPGTPQGTTLPSPMAFRTFALTPACSKLRQPAEEKSNLCWEALMLPTMSGSALPLFTMVITSALVRVFCEPACDPLADNNPPLGVTVALCVLS